MKRIVSFLLALVMILGLATTAFAAETTYSLTLNNAISGQIYQAFQIFAGDLNGSTLSNIVWGAGVTDAGKTALGDAADKADTLKTTADAEAFAAAVAQYLKEENFKEVSVASNATSAKITGLPAGYYLIRTRTAAAENGAYTYYVMKVVKDTTAVMKHEVPNIEKAVTPEHASIGYTVTFTLTATMPSSLQGYETYKVIFHDTLSAGLTFGTYESAKIGDTDVKTSFTKDSNGQTVTFTCDDVIALGAGAGDKIVITYTAKLNNKAVIGADGNPNTVYLEYSNDPNWNGEGDEPTGDTPEKEVKVYTWEFPVFKYTGTNTPLAGAGFTLSTDDAGKNVIKLTKSSDTLYNVNPSGTVTEVVTGSTGKFEIEGLAPGTYYLTEKTTPAGYNSLPAAVKVTIDNEGNIKQGGTKVSEVKIQNNAGATLPETGGMGTTLFYIFGAIMMVGAAVLLVTKRRMNYAA